MTVDRLLWNDGLQRSQNDVELELVFSLTPATGVNFATYVGPAAPRALIEGGTGSALTTITQATVDALLGSTNEVIVATAFGTTAMIDNDTYAWVLDCGGQVRSAYYVTTTIDIAGTIASQDNVATTTPFTNTAFTGTQVYVTANGNLAGRVDFTNVSAAATAGYLVLRIRIKCK